MQISDGSFLLETTDIVVASVGLSRAGVSLRIIISEGGFPRGDEASPDGSCVFTVSIQTRV